MAEALEKLVPDRRLSLDGEIVGADIAGKITRITVDLSDGVFNECRIVFSDPDMKLIGGKKFMGGVQVRVELGYVGKLGPVFDGEIVSVEPRFVRDQPPSLVVRCLEQIHRLALAPKTRAFTNATPTQILQKIAKDNGLSGDGPAGGSQQFLLQPNVSDYQLLQKIAARTGHRIALDGKKLKLAPPPSLGDLDVLPGDGVKRLKVALRSTEQVPKVTVRGWDWKQKREIVANASPTGEAGEGASSAKPFARGDYFIEGVLVNDTAEAQAMAKAAVARIAERHAVASGEMVGNPALIPGKVLSFDKLGELLDGKYRITTARHEFDKKGYGVRFEATRVAKKKTVAKFKAPPKAEKEIETTFIEAVLVDQSGRPVPNVRATIEVAGEAPQSFVTDNAGKVRMEKVPKGKTYSITFHQDEPAGSHKPDPAPGGGDGGGGGNSDVLSTEAAASEAPAAASTATTIEPSTSASAAQAGRRDDEAEDKVAFAPTTARAAQKEAAAPAPAASTTTNVTVFLAEGGAVPSKVPFRKAFKLKAAANPSKPGSFKWEPHRGVEVTEKQGEATTVTPTAEGSLGITVTFTPADGSPSASANVFFEVPKLTLTITDADGKPAPDTLKAGVTHQLKAVPSEKIDAGAWTWVAVQEGVVVENKGDHATVTCREEKADVKLAVKLEVAGRAAVVVQHPLRFVRRLVRFVSPAAGEHKQFVNLEAGADPAEGTKIKVRIQLEHGRRGEKIYVSAETAKEAKARLVGAEPKPWAKSGGIVAEVTDDQGHTEFDVELPEAGGDAITLRIGDTERCGAESLKIVSWRKVFVQTTLMKPEFTFPLDTAIAELRRVFVELVPTTTNIADQVTNLAHHELKPFATRHFKPTKRPFEAHLVLIETHDEPQDQEFTVVVPNGGATVHCGPLWPNSDWLLDAQWSRDSKDWKPVKTVRVDSKTPPPLAPPSGEFVEITADEVGGGVRINASADFVNKYSTIWVKVRLTTWQGSFTGDASYAPHIFVAQPNRPLSEKTKTLVHEFGHALGLVKRGSELHYSNRNGGYGDHCRQGATPNEKSLAEGGAFVGDYQDGTCVMFHEASEHFRFCPICLAVAKGASLARARLTEKGW